MEKTCTLKLNGTNYNFRDSVYVCSNCFEENYFSDGEYPFLYKENAKEGLCSSCKAKITEIQERDLIRS